MALKNTTKQYEIEDCIRESVLTDVRAERARQDHLCEDPVNRLHGWRKFNEPESKLEYKLSVLIEEVGEVGSAVLNSSDVKRDRHLYKELIQVAATAVAWAEAIEQ